MKPWTFAGTPFSPTYPEILIHQHYGFIYLIRNQKTDRDYIGQKVFHSFRGKGKVESGWREYWGSSDSLTLDLISLGADHFTRDVLSLHQTPADLNYEEVRQLFLHDVLRARNAAGQPKFYNQSIPSISFNKRQFTTPDASK